MRQSLSQVKDIPFLLLFEGCSQNVLRLYHLGADRLCVALKLSLIWNADISNCLRFRYTISASSVLRLRKMHGCECLDSLS